MLERRREGDYLLLWQNAPTAVIGLNQIAAAEVDTEYAAAHGIAVVRRSTGGGAVYHDAGNLNYSLIGDAGDAAAADPAAEGADPNADPNAAAEGADPNADPNAAVDPNAAAPEGEAQPQ